MKTLIAEDDPASNLLLCAALAPYAVECHSVGDGAAALELYKRSHMAGDPYRLVCLDVQMPVMDGFAALAGIRGHESDLDSIYRAKVVMVTALSDAHKAAEAFRLECDAYLVKPYNPLDISKLLDELGLHGENA